MVHAYHGETGKELALVRKISLGNIPAKGFPSSRMMPDGKSLLLGRGNLPVLLDLDTRAETLLDVNTSDVAGSTKHDFLLTGSHDGKVQLWSLKESKIVEEFPGAVFGVNAVALAPNGKRVLACSGQNVLMWDRDNPQDRCITIAHDGIVVHAAFAPDSQRILSGDQGGVVRLGNVETGEVIRQVKHAGRVTALAFHPDGRRALTAGSDNIIRIWRLP
jgi:WD40 repeat protein